MRITIGELHGKPATLELKDGIVYINDEAQPIKNLTEEDLRNFQDKLDALPEAEDEEARKALVNSVRAAFLSQLMGKAVGDECVNLISHLLDHAHYDVLKYLGEVDEDS